MKIYFYSIKINLHSVRSFFITDIYVFLSSKTFFYYMIFSVNYFLVNTSGPPFLFTKVKFLLSVHQLSISLRV